MKNTCLKHVFCSVKNILMEVFMSICGHSIEAAMSAFDSFIQENKHEKNLGDSNDEVLKSLANCYIRAKRGSVEKQGIRAMLCKHITRKNMDGMCKTLPGFTL